MAPKAPVDADPQIVANMKMMCQLILTAGGTFKADPKELVIPMGLSRTDKVVDKYNRLLAPAGYALKSGKIFSISKEESGSSTKNNGETEVDGDSAKPAAETTGPSPLKRKRAIKAAAKVKNQKDGADNEASADVDEEGKGALANPSPTKKPRGRAAGAKKGKKGSDAAEAKDQEEKNAEGDNEKEVEEDVAGGDA